MVELEHRTLLILLREIRQILTRARMKAKPKHNLLQSVQASCKEASLTRRTPVVVPVVHMLMLPRTRLSTSTATKGILTNKTASIHQEPSRTSPT